jgi:hypothetical protein
MPRDGEVGSSLGMPTLLISLPRASIRAWSIGSSGLLALDSICAALPWEGVLCWLGTLSRLGVPGSCVGGCDSRVLKTGTSWSVFRMSMIRCVETRTGVMSFNTASLPPSAPSACAVGVSRAVCAVG